MSGNQNGQQGSTAVLEEVLAQYRELNAKFDAFVEKHAVPLEYVREELNKRRRRDKFIDKVQENVMSWAIIGVFTGLAGAALWLAKLAWKNLVGP